MINFPKTTVYTNLKTFIYQVEFCQLEQYIIYIRIYRYLLMNWQTNHQRAGKMLPLVSWESMPTKTYGPTGPPKTLVPQNKAGYFLEGSRD